jgi:hypothetical protein
VRLSVSLEVTHRRTSKFFKFEAKFGWSKVVAVAALLVSLYTLLTQDRISVSIAQEISHEFDYNTDTERWHVFYDRVTVTNTDLNHSL